MRASPARRLVCAQGGRFGHTGRLAGAGVRAQGHEYLFDDEEKQRTFGEHLVFYTGAAYMSGIVVGSTMGMLGTPPRAPRASLAAFTCDARQRV